jgi:hypothetical protein
MSPILGIPLSWCGNFAIVFKLVSPTGEAWAVKCFTREVADQQGRYGHISRHLEQSRKRFAVQMEYQAEGLLLGGKPYPIVKMAWVEGQTLNELVRSQAGSPGTLSQLGQLWLRLASELREARMAHGDLQHGNVLLVPGKSASAMVLRLVDYDGMWVPDLDGKPPGERGHPNYQHPERLRSGGYFREVDRFSHLVIYTAFQSLITGGAALWSQHDNGENLLFREADFAHPATSRLFPSLLTQADPSAAALAGHLACASVGPLNEVPLVTELVGSADVQPLSTAQRSVLHELYPEITAFRPAPPRLPPLPSTVPPPLPAPEWLLSAAATAPSPSVPPPPPPVPEVRPLPAMEALDTPDLTFSNPTQAQKSSPAAFYTVLGITAGLSLILMFIAVWMALGPKGGKPAAHLTQPTLTQVPPGGSAIVQVRAELRGLASHSAAILTIQGIHQGVVARVIKEAVVQGAATFDVELTAQAEAAGSEGRFEALLASDGATLGRASIPFEVRPIRARVGEISSLVVRAGESADLSTLVFSNYHLKQMTPILDGLPRHVTQGRHRLGKDGKLTILVQAGRECRPGLYPVTLQMMVHGKEAARGSFSLEVQPLKEEVGPTEKPKEPLARKLEMTGAKSLRVVAGKPEPFQVRLARVNVEGPVTVRSAGPLPPNILMEPTEVPEEMGAVVIEPGAEAAPGRYRLRLEAVQSEMVLGTMEVELEVENAPRVPPPPKMEKPLPTKTLLCKTGDGLTLVGRLWVAKKPKEALTVLILPDPRRPTGLDATVKKLAEALQKEGHSVCSFDFRGQGRNTYKDSVLPRDFFSATRANMTLFKTLSVRSKGEEVSDLMNLPASYIPWLVQDVIAVRHELDLEHDEGNVNTSNLMVVGIGEGGHIATLWLFTECLRIQVADPDDPACRDFKKVALVGAPAFSRPSWTASALHLKLLPMIKPKVSVSAFTDFAGSGAGASLASRISHKGVKPTILAIGPTGLLGHPYLAQEKVQEALVKSARNVAEARLQPWARRGYEKASYTWQINIELGRVTEAMKLAEQSAPRQFPLHLFGFPTLGSYRDR